MKPQLQRHQSAADACGGRSRSLSDDDDELEEAEQPPAAARRPPPSSSAYHLPPALLVVLVAPGPWRWQLALQRGLWVAPTHQPSAWQPAVASTPAPRGGSRSTFATQVQALQ